MNCPSCDANEGMIIDRKYLVTTLVRCKACRLLYRTPTTSIDENQDFYQKKYSEGFTTNLPSDFELERLKSICFKGTDRDYSKYIEILTALGCKKGDRLFEFGCSWGYGSWQFKNNGFEVQSFEISKPRAQYAKVMCGIDVVDSMMEVEEQFDIFFLSHVLEHVPSVSKVIEQGFSILRPGGLFVAFVPNGCSEYRSKNPTHWRKLWGKVHPQFLDQVFFLKYFERCSNILLCSSPYNLEYIKSWGLSKKSTVSNDLSGFELLCIVCKDS